MIRNLNFKYEDKIIFDHFNLDIKRGTWTNIIGPNGSGKSTLIKILLGLLEHDGNIDVNGYVLTNETLRDIRTHVGVVFENPDNQFVAETVVDEITFKLENLNYSKKKIKEHLDLVVNMFDIKRILHQQIDKLSNGDKQLVSLAAAIINNPKIIILDESLTKMDIKTKNKVINVLLELNKLGTTIINITHDTEELVYGDNIIILNDGKIIMHDSKDIVLLEEKKFSDLGLELPFMASLSIKLKYYDLIEKPIFDMEEMVNKLWK
jgi:energy-coupling factor transport system ATP-binding protein